MGFSVGMTDANLIGWLQRRKGVGLLSNTIGHMLCKMEQLPTPAEFKTLLQEDGLFRDYFNTFLNLPVRSLSVQLCLYCP